jgi:hypothetical protein
MVPAASTAMPSGSFSPVLAPLMVRIGAALPFAPDAYSVMLFPEELAT